MFHHRQIRFFRKNRWTLGILIYEMVVGYPPFVDEDPMGIYQKILSGTVLFQHEFSSKTDFAT
jgi:serine/threonine protein kinase